MSSSPTILIIDDEPTISQVISFEFERKKFQVIRAENGIDGLELAVSKKPDAIILDIVMPGMHGYEVCKEIRSKPELSKAVVVMTSAKSYKPDIDKAFELGVDDYVVKPTGVTDLVEIVQRHLKKRAGVV